VKFGLTESKLGLLPAVISPYVIEAIGARQARRWFATAEMFDAAEAQRIGLLHDVVNPTALDTAVQRQIDFLLKAGPRACAQAKALVRRVAAQTIATAWMPTTLAHRAVARVAGRPGRPERRSSTSARRTGVGEQLPVRTNVPAQIASPQPAGTGTSERFTFDDYREGEYASSCTTRPLRSG
jgi:hypothetical protein